MWNDRVLRLVSPKLQLSTRIWIACVGVAIAALGGELVAIQNGDGWGLMIPALVLGLPVGGLIIAIRHRSLVIASLVLTGLAFPWSAVAYHAAGTSSTAALAVLWVPYVGLPVAMALLFVDVVVRDDRPHPGPHR
jgi:hypothetical protein